MIPLEQFILEIWKIRAAQPTYRLGGSGVDGTCDCIGLIIGAIRRAGGTWPGTHGSNYAARYEMAAAPGGLGPIGNSVDLSVGEVVYKVRRPGDAGYDLPHKYCGDDLLDFYHVGVVMAVSPLEIWHCTAGADGGGIRVDLKLGKWSWAGRLARIDYGKEGGGLPMEEQETGRATAWVMAANGEPVRLRQLPGKHSQTLAKIPVGTGVQVLETGSQWCTILALGKRGYMMREFLRMETHEAGEAR